MVELILVWPHAAVFLMGCLSPGWAAAVSGILFFLNPDVMPSVPAAAALGGFSRDCALYLYAFTGGWLPRRDMQVSVAQTIGLQSLQLFRWDLALSYGIRRQQKTEYFAALLISSAAGAAACCLCTYLLMRLAYRGGLGLFEAKQTLLGLILLALLAAESLRIVLERWIERFGTTS